MAPLKALVFDLDDTLYPEEAYVRSGFRAVAAWAAARGPMGADEVFSFLWSAHHQGRRGRIFDDLLAAAPGLAGEVTVKLLVDVYRAHSPDIQLYDGMAALLDEAASRNLKRAVISDGFLEAQRMKVQALGLSRWFDPILLTDERGRGFWKPDPHAFREVQQSLGTEPGGMVYIGNNPTKDFQAPRALGWRTVHLVMPGQIETGDPVCPAEIQLAGVPALRSRLFGDRGDLEAP